jgi:hypothetical protein
LKSLEQNSDCIIQNITSLRDDMTARLEDGRKTLEQAVNHLDRQGQDPLRDRLLAALSFPEMSERRNMIEERVPEFGKTFEWIFALPHDRIPTKGYYPSHEFAKWLQSGQRLFWIRGKPASGKSTLVDYIYRQLQLSQSGFHYLAKWSSSRPVQLLSFWFFRPASSELLKSAQGFWRSLCFQILDADRALARKIRSAKTGNVPLPRTLADCFAPDGSRAESWTSEELKAWLLYLLNESEFSYCILVDGLDEVVNGRDSLLKSINDIIANTEWVKICCSSRPEQPFEKALGTSPKLTLENFNHEDISRFCDRRLTGTAVSHLAAVVTSRAEGVFLWAHMVVRELEDGLANGDSRNDLEKRLDETPDEVNELFVHLLERQNRYYRNHPKFYLRLIDACAKTGSSTTFAVGTHVLTALDLLLASYEQQGELGPSLSVPPTRDCLDELDNMAIDMSTNVVARCAGLVEYSKSPSYTYTAFPEEFPHKALSSASATEIRFIHRCAQDFLREEPKGIAFLKSCEVSEQDAWKRLLFASAITASINENIFRPVDRVFRTIPSALEYSRRIEQSLWTSAETTILDDLFAAFYSRAKRRQKYPGIVCSDALEALEGQCSCSVVCPDLSAVENISYNWAVTCRTWNYIKSMLQASNSLRSRKLSGVILAIFLAVGSSIPAVADSSIAEMLVPHVFWDDVVSLCYNFGYGDFFSVELPLWQHVQTLLINGQFAIGSARGARLKRMQEMFSTVQNYVQPHVNYTITGQHSARGPFGGPSKEISFQRKCCLEAIFIGSHARKICPATPQTLATLRLKTKQQNIFTILVSLHENVARADITVELQRLRAAGTEYFLEIDPNLQPKLRFTLDEHGLRFGDFESECVAATLNHHFAKLCPGDVARTIKLNHDGPHLILESGRFYSVGMERRRSWEAKVKEKRYYKNTTMDNELDEYIRAIIDEFEPMWADEDAAKQAKFDLQAQIEREIEAVGGTLEVAAVPTAEEEQQLAQARAELFGF